MRRGRISHSYRKRQESAWTSRRIGRCLAKKDSVRPQAATRNERQQAMKYCVSFVSSLPLLRCSLADSSASESRWAASCITSFSKPSAALKNNAVALPNYICSSRVNRSPDFISAANSHLVEWRGPITELCFSFLYICSYVRMLDVAFARVHMRTIVENASCLLHRLGHCVPHQPYKNPCLTALSLTSMRLVQGGQRFARGNAAFGSAEPSSHALHDCRCAVRAYTTRSQVWFSPSLGRYRWHNTKEGLMTECHRAQDVSPRGLRIESRFGVRWLTGSGRRWVVPALIRPTCVHTCTSSLFSSSAQQPGI